MKILVLKSSGNKKGSSVILADEFIRGAKENGHDITEYSLIRKDIRPCTGCNACGMDGPCVQKDDYEKELKTLIKQTDMIVFAMPVYSLECLVPVGYRLKIYSLKYQTLISRLQKSMIGYQHAHL